MLEAPYEREPDFRVGTEVFDEKNVGFANNGGFLFRTNKAGNTNSGHFDFSGAAALTDSEKEDLLAYLRSI